MLLASVLLIGPPLLVGDAFAVPPDDGVVWSAPLDSVLDYESGEALRLGLLAAGGDVDGDERPDLLLGSEDAGTVTIRSGHDFELLRVHTSGESTPGFGWAVTFVADVDGDGRSEYAIGHPDLHAGGGRVALHSGADGSVLWTVDVIGDDSRPAAAFGASLADVGDLDGDGVHDLAVGSPGAGRAAVLSGADGDELWSDTFGDGIGYGFLVRAAADSDGDGVPDVLVGAHQVGSTSVSRDRIVRVLSGVDGALLLERAFTKSSADNLFSGFAPAGDWERDGGVDLAILTSPQVFDDEVHILAGPGGALLDAVDPYPDEDVPAFLAAPRPELLDVFPAGDTDGDGVDDLACGARFLFRGRIALLAGGTGALLREREFPTPNVTSQVTAAAAGDVDGDGYADVAAGLHAAFNASFPSEALLVFGGDPWVVGPRARVFDSLPPGGVDRVQVDVLAGSRVRATLRSTTKDGVVPSLALVDVDGTPLGEPSVGKKSALLVLDAPSSGRVTLVASHVGETPGDSRLTVRVRPPPKVKGTVSAPAGGDALPLPVGQKAVGDVATGAATSFLVQATAGTSLDLKARRSGGGALVPRVTVTGPIEGWAPLPASAELLPGVAPKSTAKGHVLRKVIVPWTGTYRVDVLGADGSAGGFRLTTRARPPKGTHVVTAPQPLDD